MRLKRRRVASTRMPRGLKGWATVLVLLTAVSIVAGIPYFVAGKDAQRPPLEAVSTKLTLPPGTSLEGLEKGRVDAIVDGDTIDVHIDGKMHRVRYFGVDTPERGDRCYREATDRNEILVGKEVLLLKDKRETDRYNRTLRYVFLTDGTSVDATLVAEGFGHAWTDDGRYKDEIIRLEGEAKAAGRGCLWK